jgi:hypothetical protein
MGNSEPQHNPAARYCIVIDHAIPIDDYAECVACQEAFDLARLDPDFEDEYRDYERPRARFAPPCPHDSLSGDEGPVDELGRMPQRWRCDQCGAILAG